MTRIIQILAILLIISTACKENHTIVDIEITDKPYPLKFIKEKETRIDEVGYPVLCSLKNSKNIMVRLSLRNSVILTYSRDLELVKKDTIKYGEGPNECLHPIIMGAGENHIIVSDIINQRFYKYDVDFKTRKRLRAKQVGWIPHGFNFSFKYNTVLSCVKPFDPSTGIYRDYNVILRKIMDDRVTYREIFTLRSLQYLVNYILICGRPIHFRMINDHVYILNKKEYAIIKMDIDGRVIKEIRVTGLGEKSFSRRERGDWVEAVGLNYKRSKFTYPKELWHANGILEIAGGIAVIRINDYKPVKKKWIDADYFDYDLNFLGKIKLPWFPRWNYPGQIQSDLFFFSKGHILYFIDDRETEDDDDFWLTRWRIEK